MIQLNHIFTSKSKLEKVLKENRNYENLFVQVFYGQEDISTYSKVVKTILNIFPKAQIIGTSTAGEISDEHSLEQTILLSLSFFEKTSIISESEICEDEFETGFNLANKVLQKDTRAMILFSDGLLLNGEKVLNGIKKAIEGRNIIVAGGAAGDYARFKKTHTFHQSKVLEKGVVLASLNSKKLRVSNGYNLGWTPIGRKLKITKAKANQVFEIDNRPVADVYREYLGEEVVKNMPDSTIEFPLIMEKDNTLIARSMIRVDDDGSIFFAGELPEGTCVKFGIGNEFSMRESLNQNLSEYKDFSPEVQYIYSCIARKSFFGKKIEYELSQLSNLSPTAGFFTYGEFYNSQHENLTMNITTTIISLSESNSKKSYKDREKESFSKQGLSIYALSHLLKKTLKDLDEQSNKLKESELNLNQYKHIINEQLIVSKTNPEGVITYVNDRFCLVSGYNRDELLGAPHSIIKDHSTKDTVFQEMWETIKNKQTWKGILNNRAKDGSIYVVNATISPILNADGEIIEYLAVREDITDLIHKDYILRKEKLKLDSILNNLNNIVILAQRDKHSFIINDRFFEIFDYKNLTEFKRKHNCICELFEKQESYVQQTMGELDWIDYILQNKKVSHKVLMTDKRENKRIFSIKAKQIEIEQEAFYVISFNDITEIENARKKSEEIASIKSQFLANMSHEIRTPMNGIIGFHNLLENTNLNNQQTEYLEIAKASTKTLLGIVNDVLDFSKLESGKFQLDITEINPLIELSNTAMLFEKEINEKNITFNVDIDKNIGECIKVDLLRLNQVISNLLSNAIKFTEKNGEISFCVENIDTNRIKFSVKDSGIGIEKDKQDKIFEAFSQADSSTTRNFGGTGLGLSISSHLVRLMDGKLQLKSDLNRGSEFFFEINAPKCNKKITSKKIVSQTTPSLNGKVLVVEDNKVNQILIKEILKTYSLDVTLANNGLEATQIASNNFDLIFMDINMPVMSGTEALKQLKKQKITTPIVALTANSMAGDRERFLELGFDNYISKPISNIELNKLLHLYLSENDTPKTPNSETILNLNALRKDYYGLPDNILKEILNSYVNNSQSLLDSIEHIDIKNLKVVKDVMHSIKGVAGNLKLEQIASLAKILEKEAKDGIVINLDDLEKLKSLILQSVKEIEDSNL